MSYNIEGRLLEVCTCNVLCPCWIGEDPDNGTCDASLAYHIDKGEIDGVGVSGLTVAGSTHIPGNVLEGNWQARSSSPRTRPTNRWRRSSRRSPAKRADRSQTSPQLIGEVVEFDRAPISFDVSEGKGTYRVGDVVDAEIEPYLGPTGEPTTLHESVFSTIPGSPAFVGKAPVLPDEEPCARARRQPRGPQRDPGHVRIRGVNRRVLRSSSVCSSASGRALRLRLAGHAVALAALALRPLPRPRRLDPGRRRAEPLRQPSRGRVAGAADALRRKLAPDVGGDDAADSHAAGQPLSNHGAPARTARPCSAF